jgi:hypothetical protein
VENPTASPNASAPAAPPALGATLLRVAWLSVLLGLAMEGILLLLGSGLGEALGAGTIAADLARNVSWAVFVCVGLAIGTTVAKSQLPLIGLTGLLAAPTAFEVSRVVHKGVGEALSAPADASTTSALLIAFVKALEYGFLGIAVGWLAERAWAGAAAYAAAGLVAGLIFGGTIVSLRVAASGALPAVAIVTQAFNEILFPVGCALVLFAAGAVAKRMKPEG